MERIAAAQRGRQECESRDVEAEQKPRVRGRRHFCLLAANLCAKSIGEGDRAEHYCAKKKQVDMRRGLQDHVVAALGKLA